MNLPKILVVDDFQEIRELLQIFLNQASYEVIEAESGKDALAKLNSNHIDLILTDVRMPDGDGMYLLKEVRKKYKDLPVFIMSGYTDFSIEDFKREGATGFLNKPLEVEGVVKSINQHFGRAEKFP